MSDAWLIYNKEDYTKNTYFANELIDCAKKQGLSLRLVFRENIVLGIKEQQLFISDKQQYEKPYFVINRSRDSFLARHLELMGILVFNNSRVTSIGNNKSITHQFISRLGIRMVNMFFCSKEVFDLSTLEVTYPVVVKSVSGHGGSEVFKCSCEEEVMTAVHQIKSNHFLVQQLCSREGIDVRIFALEKRVLGAVKRESKTDFRSNYSLGGKASLYELTDENKQIIHLILENLKSDFVGIDFMLDDEGRFIFNEIEDVVGSRTLYEQAKINTAQAYISYIAAKLQK